MRRSTELVRGRWLHTAVLISLFNVLPFVTAAAIGLLLLLVVESLPSNTELQQALDEFDSLCDEAEICAPDSHLTRDQLHERN